MAIIRLGLDCLKGKQCCAIYVDSNFYDGVEIWGKAGKPLLRDGCCLLRNAEAAGRNCKAYKTDATGGC